MHKHRDEMWNIVEGSCVVDLDEQRLYLGEGAQFYVRALQRHKVTNKYLNNNEHDLVAIEIQLGDYLEEDDIIRLEDIDE